MRTVRLVVLAMLASVALAAPVRAGCPLDSVNVGDVCIDKYEESVWQIAPSNAALIRKVQKGKATLADLTNGGAVPLGCTFTPFGLMAYPATFPANGNWTPVPGSNPPTPGIYAVSIAGAMPSTCITWFQAEQACALANKRLIRNQEWQRAAAGTVDPGFNDGTANTKCNTGCQFFGCGDRPRTTGSAGATPGGSDSCISNWGAEDMVGNVMEWTGDWGDSATNCAHWSAIYGNDLSCVGGDGSVNLPGTPIRGGHWGSGTDAGIFNAGAGGDPSGSTITSFAEGRIGFRCAR